MRSDGTTHRSNRHGSALHTRFHFGKYRGKRYADIAANDPDYLRWIIEKSVLEEGIKHSAKYWLSAAAANPTRCHDS
jgi:hypothetical protein